MKEEVKHVNETASVYPIISLLVCDPKKDEDPESKKDDDPESKKDDDPESTPKKSFSCPVTENFSYTVKNDIICQK